MIKAKNLSVTYNRATRPSLSKVNIQIPPGRLVLVTGPTGSGKSTLLMGLGGILQHESSANISGDVRLAGISIRDIPLKNLCRHVGWVFQNPATQICAGTPEREVAFGLENLCIERKDIGHRIEEGLELVGLENQRFQKTHTLSGGEQQRLVIAAALALRPKVLLLDEPLSQLDPGGAADILQVLADLKTELNIAIVMVEHRLEGALQIADDLVILNGGKVVKQGPTRTQLQDLRSLRTFGIEPPPLLQLFDKMGRHERPLSADEALKVIGVGAIEGRPTSSPFEKGGRGDFQNTLFKSSKHNESPLLHLKNIDIRHNKKSKPIFKDLSLTINKGDRIALIGANGVGKTTLLHLLAGVLKPSAGTVTGHIDIGSDTALVMQNPDVMLISDSVEEELAFYPKQQGENSCLETTQSVLEKLSLLHLAKRAPFSLSRGERQRTAVGSVLTGRPKLLLLDEPTTGQDRRRIDRMMQRINYRCDAVIFSTHDMETAAKHANRVIVLKGGQMVADASPNALFYDWKTLAIASIKLTEMQQFAKQHPFRHPHTTNAAEALI